MGGAAKATSSSRYDTILKLASGGMATVWVGTVRGALGFRQLVAIKKPHPHLLGDPSFRSEIVAEARLASMIHHANVVDVRDVEIDGESISLVMDYIEGASLGELLVACANAGKPLPPRVAVRIAVDALAGLHAAHELVDERDRPVGLVHRDVSPQNILVGTDGIARVADFGVAKFARKNMASTSEGSLKGKLAYMAPEYLRGESIDRRFDIFALGIVLWETLTGKRLFRGANEAETLRLLLEHHPESLVTAAPAAAALEGVLATALARAVDERFQNAQAMAAALEATALTAGLCGGHTEVAAALKDLVGPMIEERRALIRTKQAHEPSIASLMGLDPVSNGPKTTVDVPTTQPLGNATVSPQTNVPSTLPMTPRMQDAPVRTLAMTPPGAPALARAPAPSGPALGGGATLASATPAADPAAVARAEGSIDTQLSFSDPSVRTAHDPSLVDFAPNEPRTGRDSDERDGALPVLPRSRLFPVIAGIVAVIGAAGAIAFAATRTKPATAEERAPVSASDSASVNPAPLGVTPAPPSSIAAALPSPVASASARPGARRPAGAAHAPTAPALPAVTATALPTATPTATGKKPPPNPYATDVQ